MKTCTKCNLSFSLDHFCKMKLAPDGLSYYCRACRSKLRKMWHKAHNGYMKQYNKNWRANHPEYGSIYHQRNKDKRQEQKRLWLLKHPYAHSAHERKRRELKFMLDYKYSKDDERTTRIVFNNLCFNCGSNKNLEIDHHYPLSKGYGLHIGNAVLLCSSCNTSKNNKMPNCFYSKIKFDQVEYILELLEQ